MEKKAFEEFYAFLKSKGFKLTNGRKIILEKIFATHEHINAEDLFLLLRKRKENISRATVYRTLDLLVKSGLVQKISFGEKYAVYEHVLGHSHHDHLICIRCGTIKEFSDSSMIEKYKTIADANSFKPLAFRLQIFGYCSKCQNEPQ